MTTAADDSAVEEAFEAYLAGRAVPAEGADLAAFAGAVRATAVEPGRPNAALAELLATGLLVTQPTPPVRTANRRRRRMWFFSVIFAKIASAGAIAQAATGAGIVLVGFTGIGAAGALPTPVQHTFATVVAAVTPLTAPDDTDKTVGTTDPAQSTTSATTTAPTEGAVVGGAATATTSAPKNHGQEVSSLAHERNAARKSAHKQDSADSADSADSDSADSDSDDSDDSDATATATAPTSPETSGSTSSGGASSDQHSSDEVSGHGSDGGSSAHGH